MSPFNFLGFVFKFYAGALGILVLTNAAFSL